MQDAFVPFHWPLNWQVLTWDPVKMYPKLQEKVTLFGELKSSPVMVPPAGAARSLQVTPEKKPLCDEQMHFQSSHNIKLPRSRAKCTLFLDCHTNKNAQSPEEVFGELNFVFIHYQKDIAALLLFLQAKPWTAKQDPTGICNLGGKVEHMASHTGSSSFYCFLQPNFFHNIWNSAFFSIFQSAFTDGIIPTLPLSMFLILIWI